ncbi:MAG: hypothetical protein ACYS9X_02940 [Planctomycetota bacterium]|jgi:uncharacterized protein YfaP (DUF2135 family)
MRRAGAVAAVSIILGFCSCDDDPLVPPPGPPSPPNVRVVLTWDTPGDPDQTDTGAGAGSNADLHLMLDGGAWLNAATDCYSGSMSPDWGAAGNASDDPSLDVDDPDGAGPEAITLPIAAAGAFYHIGVHYVDDSAYGPSVATVQVYIDEVLSAQYTSAALSNGQFWQVADIDWSGGTVTPVNIVTAGVP